MPTSGQTSKHYSRKQKRSEKHVFIAKYCKDSKRCIDCGSDRHHTALHFDINNATGFTSQKPMMPHSGETPENKVTCKYTQICWRGFEEKSCAKTVLMKVYPKGQSEYEEFVYTILDDQSNKTLPKPELVDKFGVHSCQV